MRRTTLTFSITAALLALAACGGGSTTPTTGTVAKVSQGVVSSRTASAITVNGVSVATAGATVIVDDNPKPESELKPGMVVKVKLDDKGKAIEIDSKSDVRGEVTAKAGTTLQVGNQVVVVDDSTEFEDDARLAGVTAGSSRVKVHGFPDDKGGLRATRIDKDDASTDFEIHGFASGLSATGFTLKVSKDATTSFSVSYGTGVVAPAGLVEGSFVEVKSATQPTGTAIVASSVKLDDDKELGEARTEAEIEGVVTSGDSTSFVIDGHTVTTTAATVFQNGLAADLVPGVKVEAEGTLDSAGNLVATKVSFRDTVRLQGAASDVTATSFTLLGRTVLLSDATEIKSGLGLANGVTVQVRGSLARDGSSIAAIRLEPASGKAGRIFVQGPVSAVDTGGKTVTVLGFTIAAGAAQFHTSDEVTVLSTDAFFAAVKVGSVVKARGNDASALVGATLTADEIELEGDR
jgi:hypothetical protein